ncbi:putative Uric acid-xanthine permease [Glarea lozoyensis 74030]|uniref:Putative Uric acid-xanthine permease n=1 Tax=Glarea lozoyensis (strain ATCC 74030 / MF5533) TaxID=1104152 RepID=H0ENH0_GLAL7|nr:putative Uric acid-xanthine permease [Glarea lozoyensis 74030]
MAVTIDQGPMDGPDRVGPDYSPKRTFGENLRAFGKAFTTKDGLIGQYDYGFLFRPNLPFMKKSTRAAPFFGLNDRMPVFLALLLGFQHALAMLAGIITPPIIIAGAANFSQKTTQYLVSTSLIVCGILSAVQITRFHIMKTPYYIGTGLISVVGTSFAIIPIATKGLSQIAPHALPWGSAEFIGLGFLVFVTIILCERFGAPIMKSLSVVLGLLVGCIVAAACGYFSDSAIATIGDITATCDVSRLQVDGKLFDSRIQGGVLADGLNVLGGMTTFLFTSVAVSGIRIIATVPFTRRTRFVLTGSMSIGLGAILVPEWFAHVFTYAGDNKAKAGFFDAIALVMETGFAVTAFLAVVLNLIIPDEIEEETAESLAGDIAEERADIEHDKDNAWKGAGIQGDSQAVRTNASGSVDEELKA